MAYPRSGSASRAVALDLMLRTFMNSADFHTTNPRIWDNIAKLVPGISPQQCAQRWEELRVLNSTVAGDLSGLAATGRPFSGHGRRQINKFVRSMLNQPSSVSKHSHVHSSVMDHTPSGYVPETRPHTALAEISRSFLDSSSHSASCEKVGGTFASNFCQTVLDRPKSGMAKSGMAKSGMDSNVESTLGEKEHIGDVRQTNEKRRESREIGPNMVIHVSDETKKLKRDFVCPRDVLIREMHYFTEYLSSDVQLWDEVDITVHCDVPIFEWLMRYTKRGMLEGPCGEKLEEPQPLPTLDPSNAVSILISSDFLKMDTLVELCLEYCHDHMSDVVVAPCNMGSIKNNLIRRLASKFSIIESESIEDKKDKMKSKMFLYHLEQMFQPCHYTPECPASAATLFKCRFCARLLTTQQQSVLPCIPERLSIDRTGKIFYSHEPESSWDVNKYIQLLQKQDGFTARDVYWSLWGVINWLECANCHQMFQCSELRTCPHHGQNQEKKCCRSNTTDFTALPDTQLPSTGCTYHDHVVSDEKQTLLSIHSQLNNRKVYAVLLKLRDTICAERLKANGSKVNSVRNRSVQVISLLQSEERKPCCLPLSQAGLTPLSSSHHGVSSANSADSIKGHSGGNLLSKQPPAQVMSRTIKTQKLSGLSDLEEDEDEPVMRAQLPVPPVRQRRGRHVPLSLLKQKHSKLEMRSQPPPVEWIWDSNKSNRLNQDMQRESDERKLATLVNQLSQKLPTQTTSTVAKNVKEITYAGGFFSRLEAQFRVQHAAKAAAQQGHQSRNTSQGSGKRRL